MKIGDIAPNFRIKDEMGNDFELYDNLENNILLIFYPKDDTPVCSTQLAEYNNNIEEFTKYEIKLVGINTNTVQSHNSFSKKLSLKFPLLTDGDKKVSKKYNALNFLGTNKRLLVLISKDREVIWIDSTMSIIYIKSKEILQKVQTLAVKK